MGDLFDDSKAVQAAAPMVQGDSELLRVLTLGNIDILERYLKMKTEMEEREAKRLFDENFCKMQAEYVPVARERSAKKDEKILYKYCPIEAILKVYAPIISRHGFSFRWENESQSEGKAIRVYCIVSGYGHERKSYADMPIGAASTFANPAQQYGTATSYGKRYSFINAFGVIIEDEDDDAQSYETEDVIKAAPMLTKIANARTLDDLGAIWPIVHKEATANGEKVLDLVVRAKDKRKGELK